MTKQISYSLAVEIDRTFSLSLSDRRFEVLVSFIDGYQNSQEITKELLLTNPKAVQNIIDNHQTK